MPQTIENLKRYYEKYLMPDLRVLEKQRKAVVTKLVYTWVGFVVILLFTWYLLPTNVEGTGDAELVLMIYYGLTLWVSRHIHKGYRLNYKDVVIRKLVRYVNNQLRYIPDKGISQDVYTQSDLFRHQISCFDAEDYVRGRIGKTLIAFSEVSARYVKGSGRTTRMVSVFHGIFFVADFNKSFQGKTVVLPDTAECEYGWLGRKLQSWNWTRDPLIELEDPEFEKAFVVYGSDQIEARYILSTSLMERILAFKQKTGKLISLSFFDQSVCIAIPISGVLFEPRLFQSLLAFEPIVDYVGMLELAVGIVEDLNLNTRIWSKK